MNELAGHYVMRATNEDVVICETLVHVLLIGHHSEPKPFLGIRSKETDQEELRGIFKPFIGKKVELSFSPFGTKASNDVKSKQSQILNQEHTIKPQQCSSHETHRDRATMGTSDDNSADYIIREYIDFVNQQVGVYMDAIAGFAGHYARVERQVCRVMRKNKSKKSDEQPVVWASYEDPSKPDIIHNRIIRSNDYMSSNSVDGSNTQQHSQAILVFLFTYWEDEIRPRLAKSINIAANEIKSDIMGDLRIIRNVILHSKGIIRQDKYKSIKLLGDPSLVGKLTNDLVYQRLAPGVLDELTKLNPKTTKGTRRHRHHQWLTRDVGHPRLREHLSAVVALMKASAKWEDFKRMINRALPKYEYLPLFDQPKNDKM